MSDLIPDPKDIRVRDLDEPRPPPLEFFEYPGERVMSAAGLGLLDTTDPDGERSSFVLCHNPLDRDAVIIIFLGPDKDLQRRLRDNLPSEHPRQNFFKCRLRIPAGGSVWLPKLWRAAVRRDVDGRTVAGLFPQALFGSERERAEVVDLHPALETNESNARTIVAIGGRRRGQP